MSDRRLPLTDDERVQRGHEPSPERFVISVLRDHIEPLLETATPEQVAEAIACLELARTITPDSPVRDLRVLEERVGALSQQLTTT